MWLRLHTHAVAEWKLSNHDVAFKRVADGGKLLEKEMDKLWDEIASLQLPTVREEKVARYAKDMLLDSMVDEVVVWMVAPLAWLLQVFIMVVGSLNPLVVLARKLGSYGFDWRRTLLTHCGHLEWWCDVLRTSYRSAQSPQNSNSETVKSNVQSSAS